MPERVRASLRARTHVRVSVRMWELNVCESMQCGVHICVRVVRQSSAAKRPTSISVLFGGTKIALMRRP